MSSALVWKAGDRVRVVQSEDAYTGCRGTVVEAPGSPRRSDPNQLPLGYFVAIDGENGVARPFLVDALEGIAAISSRSHAGDAREVGGK